MTVLAITPHPRRKVDSTQEDQAWGGTPLLKHTAKAARVCLLFSYWLKG